WLALMLCATLCGCSTVRTRMEERRAAFDKLPPAQQALVARGQVREGMGKDAVYIAWGRPDEATNGSRGGQAFEVWTYCIATRKNRAESRKGNRHFDKPEFRLHIDRRAQPFAVPCKVSPIAAAGAAQDEIADRVERIHLDLKVALEIAARVEKNLDDLLLVKR